MLADIRHVLRSLRSSPGFTLTATITLTLGIGAATAMYSVVHAVLVRPLPLPEPHRVMMLTIRSARGSHTGASTELASALATAPAFDAVAWADLTGGRIVGKGEPEEILGSAVTSAFFRVFTAPALGRPFNEAEPGTAVISHGMWIRKFGGEASVLGQTLPLEEGPLQIVGVMPQDFDFPLRRQYWTLMPEDAAASAAHGEGGFEPVARLRPGASLTEAQAQVDTILDGLRARYPAEYRGLRIRVIPLQRAVAIGIDRHLYLLGGAVLVLLLIACANVATLMMLKAGARERELAVRVSLGASPGRLVRQQIVEGIALAVPAVACGIACGYALLPPLLHLTPDAFPRIHETRIDRVVLVISAAIGAATVMLATVAPALAASRTTVVQLLARREGSTPMGRGLRLHALVAIQAALTVMLLASGGAMALGLHRLMTVETGLSNTSFAIVGMRPGLRYEGQAARQMFWTQMEESILSVAGVRWTAVTGLAPMQGGPTNGVVRVGGEIRPEDPPNLRWRSVLPSYFERLGIPIRRGRNFAASDRGAEPYAVILNETAARMLGDDEPLGRAVKLRLAGRRADGFIVGIAGDVRESLARPARPEMFLAATQLAPLQTGAVLVGSDRPIAELVPQIRNAVWRVDPAQPIDAVTTFADAAASQARMHKLRSTLFSVFGTLALVFATVAIASVVAYLVIRRTREIGIRTALGARPSQVVTLFLRESGTALLGGVAAGLIAAWNSVALLEGWTYSVRANDPAVLAAAATLFLVAGLLAAWIPARRAARIDPAVTLRAE